VLVALRDFGALPSDADVSGLVALLPEPPTMEERRAFIENPTLAQDRLALIVRALSAAGFRVPPELTLFVKNALYLNDAVMRHAPDFDMITEVMGVLGRILPTAEAE
jgi:ubiquinone biosynthesis protein